MLQFDGGQQPTTDVYPSDPPVAPNLCTLGPTQQGVGVLINSFNNLIDLELFYRDGGAPRGIRKTFISGLAPVAQVFPAAIGFRAKTHNPGAFAEVIAQVWETVDGPLPQSPLINLASLSGSGTIIPPVTSTIERVSVLPSGPVDSQVVSYIVDPTQVTWPGIEWLLMYNLSTGYWDVIGGSALEQEVDTRSTSNNAAYVTPNNGAPSITIPLLGDYYLEYGAQLFISTATANGEINYSPSIGGAGALGADDVAFYTGATAPNNSLVTGSRKRKKTALPSGTVILMQWSVAGGNVQSLQDQWLSVTPIRVHS